MRRAVHDAGIELHLAFFVRQTAVANGVVVGIILDDSDRRDDGVQRVTALLKDVHPFIEGMKTIGAGNDQRPLALRRTARKCGRSCRCAIRSGARAAKEFTRAGNRAANKRSEKEFTA